MDEGSVFHAPWRILTDGYVFRTRLRHPKKHSVGSILLDCSGSMSLTYDMIESFLESAPAANIAMYWGMSGHGILRIVAGEGKVASKEHFTPNGGLNEVDGPAMKWLCAMPGPRLWVSDGNITGLRDGALRPEVRAAFMKDLKEHSVTRIHRLDEAYLWLKNKMQEKV